MKQPRVICNYKEIVQLYIFHGLAGVIVGPRLTCPRRQPRPDGSCSAAPVAQEATSGRVDARSCFTTKPSWPLLEQRVAHVGREPTEATNRQGHDWASCASPYMYRRVQICETLPVSRTARVRSSRSATRRPH